MDESNDATILPKIVALLKRNIAGDNLNGEEGVFLNNCVQQLGTDYTLNDILYDAEYRLSSNNSITPEKHY